MAGRQSVHVVLSTLFTLGLLALSDGGTIAYADGGLCGMTVKSGMDLNAAIREFIGESDCSVIEMGANIQIVRDDPLLEPIALVANGPLDAIEPVNKSLTIDGKGFTLTGDSEVSGFVIFLGLPDSIHTLTVRNLHLTAFGGSGALTVVSGATAIERGLFTNNSFMSESVLLGTQDASAGAVNAYGRLSITESQFEDNSGSKGGAVYSSPDLDLEPPQTGGPNSRIQISRSSFFGNEANPGGSAVFSRQPLTMSNSTVTGNSGESLGALNVVGSAFLDFCTIIDNTSTGSGGGVSATLNIAISNSIVYRNLPKDAYGYENITITSSLVTSQESISSTLVATSLDESNIVDEDPLLADLGDYRGFKLPGSTTIRTRPPQSGSPVIDKVDPATVGVATDPTDQRGTDFPRIINGRADMGSVEYWPAVVPDPPIDTTDPLPDFSDFPWSFNVDRKADLPDTK